MLLERSEIQIQPGLEEAFAAMMKERGLPVLSAFPGVTSVQIGRGLENPSKFLLLVGWDAMESHTAFKQSPIYPEFGQLFRPFSKGGAMEHFNMF